MTWDRHTLREDEGHTKAGAAAEGKHSLAEYSTAEHSGTRSGPSAPHAIAPALHSTPYPP